MDSPDSANRDAEGFFSSRARLMYNQQNRNKGAELDGYKKAYALQRLRGLVERLHFIGNVYALNVQQLTQEIEKRERRISDTVSLGITLQDDDGDTFVVASEDFTKDDDGARTVTLFNTKNQNYISIPLYDLLSRTWSRERGEVIINPSQISLKTLNDYRAYFTHKLKRLLNDTTVDISIIQDKARLLAKTAKGKKRTAVNAEYLENAAREAAEQLRLQDR